LIKNFLKQFNLFKENLATPESSLKVSIANFERDKATHFEDKTRPAVDWEDNVLNNTPKILFSIKEYDEYVQKYQDFKGEMAGELDNPNWYIESSEALTAMMELKELIRELELIYDEFIKNRDQLMQALKSVTVKLNSLNKLLYGNDEVQSWFYSGSVEGLSSCLYFLSYAVKNNY
jgi:hypothetical protein